MWLSCFVVSKCSVADMGAYAAMLESSNRSRSHKLLHTIQSMTIWIHLLSFNYVIYHNHLWAFLIQYIIKTILIYFVLVSSLPKSLLAQLSWLNSFFILNTYLSQLIDLSLYVWQSLFVLYNLDFCWNCTYL